MQKVRIFKSIENELSAMEREINEWIERDRVRVITITGNIASQTPGSHVGSYSASDVLIVVLYEEESK